VTPEGATAAAGPAAPTVTVRPISGRADLKRFVKFPWKIYADDPYWVPPLITQQLGRLDRKKNPLFGHADMQLFLAEEGGRVVGTISALINRRRNEYLGLADGYFGFFECADDPEVARALIDAVADWCRERGMDRLRGPIDLDESEEVGLLVEGFETRQALMLAHTPRYYIGLIEGLGFSKWYDTMAWWMTRDDVGGKLENLPRKLFVAAERVRRREGVTIRQANLKDWDHEIALLFEMYNETIAVVNQSFVPIEYEELRHIATELKQIVDPTMALLAEVPDETRPEGTRPVGFAVAVPDINQILRSVNGRLLPFGWLKLLLDMKHVDALSFKLLGVMPDYRLRGIDGLLMLEVIKAAWDRGYQTCEMSVIDERNVEMQRDLAALGARVYRTYRVYERAL
jgi:GNAT superfamily N-acetyltransferase